MSGTQTVSKRSRFGRGSVPPAARARRAGWTPPTWLRENLEHSLPFLVVGAACLGLAIWMRASEVHSFGLRMPLWTLLAAIGVTVGAGGLALTLVEEPDEHLPEGHSDLVMVEREVWEKLQEEVGSIPEEAPAPSSEELDDGRRV